MNARLMSKAWRSARALLIACGALTSPPVAHAGAVSTDAAVVILDPVGAGFSFDILSDTVSAVFLNGDAGDSVSLLMSGRKPGTKNAPRDESGVLVMASGVYRIDLLQPTASNGPLRGALRRSAQKTALGGNSILFLAQFN